MLKLKLETDNQAFNQEGQEVARILRGLADRLENLDKLQESQLPLRDINGNNVGYYQTWTRPGRPGRTPGKLTLCDLEEY